ncbi:MAG: FGGY family carbohydrate kinase, partial [Microbacterium sp.]
MLIGIDLGTSSFKAIAVDDDGVVVAKTTANYPLINLRSGWSEQEPAEWWRATGEAMTALAAKLPEGGKEITAIGLCGQMHGLTAMDADGEVIRPAILWNDQRCAAECDWITEQVGG